MKMSANPIQACLDTILSPLVAFDTVKEKKGWSWLPFILLTSSTFVLFIYYFSVVDFTWLKEQMINQIAASKPMTDDELKAVASFYQKDTMIWTTAIGGSLGFVVINMLTAVYYHIVTKVSAASEYKFTQWFAFTWWASFPAIISVVLSALVIVFAGDGRVSMQDLQPTSFNSLLFSVEANNAWFGLLEAINLFSFWLIAVTTIGLRSWLNINNQKAFFIAAAPQILIFISWALYILFIA
ncbi:YIP1 family protein [Colwellia hornerae]|uniref:YIP1 family protein n=1 Tax=Colwellia hornerae TaxID=89402 RepID=A0A5C6QN78_9GAMM|nr:YIP1 family protein [Colwellia hornerae]TWX56242.1 YIP1 family protein [Colwellia hornerae]TWX62093.1 YIP1 family protein [Colwellia hornerae]TWX70495.1 YIP1 family protein [Colwellia hornerae]